MRLAGRVGSHRAPCTGPGAGRVSLSVNWRIGGNSRAGPVLVILTGHFGEYAVKLNGDFRLAPSYFFEEADIAGDLGEAPFRAVVSAADGGLGSTDVVVAEGTVGEAPFQLFAALSGDLTKAAVRGSVDGRPVSLDASRDEPSGPVKVCGSYSGPPGLLASMVGALSYFL